jgi:anti-sigma factor RsiW
MKSSPDIDPDTAADLTALADGSLDAARRAEVAERAARTPELAAALAEQQRAIALLSRARDVTAPEPLRQSVQQLADQRGIHLRWPARRQRGSVSAPSKPRLAPRRAFGVAAAGGVVVAAAVVAVVLVLSGGSPSAPGLPRYLALGSGPSTMAPPAKSATQRNQLAIGVGSVAFPYWEDRFGWRAAGARVDRVAGRAVTTVFYANASGSRISYSIVAGTAPGVHGSAAVYSRGTTVSIGGVRYWLGSAGGSRIVLWNRAGHRCILTGRGVSGRSMLALASWNGERGATS